MNRVRSLLCLRHQVVLMLSLLILRTVARIARPEADRPTRVRRLVEQRAELLVRCNQLLGRAWSNACLRRVHVRCRDLVMPNQLSRHILEFQRRVIFSGLPRRDHLLLNPILEALVLDAATHTVIVVREGARL